MKILIWFILLGCISVVIRVIIYRIRDNAKDEFRSVSQDQDHNSSVRINTESTIFDQNSSVKAICGDNKIENPKYIQLTGDELVTSQVTKESVAAGIINSSRYELSDADIQRFAKILKDFADFWLCVKSQILFFKQIDVDYVIHGSNPKSLGHGYQILPTLSIPEILSIETIYNINLPDELSSFLLIYGSGGAGPGYGIQELRLSLKEADLSRPFQYIEKSQISGDCADNDPIEDFSGLVYLGTEGCCTENFIQIHGESTGKIWCNWGDGGCNSFSNLCEFYSKWLDISQKSIESKYGSSQDQGRQ